MSKVSFFTHFSSIVSTERSELSIEDMNTTIPDTISFLSTQ
jgi:hypothetical protein